MPWLTKPAHCLSSIMGAPPSEALSAALGLLAECYDRRMHGITLGATSDRDDSLRMSLSADFDFSDGAPAGLAGLADATWNNRALYGILITAFGGAIFHTAKLLHLLVDSSTESEAVATGKLGEAIAYAREIFRGLGIPCQGPTPCWTDNKANQLLSSGEGAPTRMRHAIRRFNVFKQRVEFGEVRTRARHSSGLLRFPFTIRAGMSRVFVRDRGGPWVPAASLSVDRREAIELVRVRRDTVTVTVTVLRHESRVVLHVHHVGLESTVCDTSHTLDLSHASRLKDRLSHPK